MPVDNGRERIAVPAGLPGWRVLLGLAFLIVGIVVGLVLLMRGAGSGVSPGLSDSNPRGLYVMDVDGKHKQLLLAHFHGSWPMYAAEGRDVIFVGQAEGASVGTVFSRLSAGKTSAYAIGDASDLWRPDEAVAPAWSPDRRHLLAVGSDGDPNDPPAVQHQRLYLADLSGSKLLTRRVVASSEKTYRWNGLLAVSWARSGRVVYVDESRRGSALWLADGLNETSAPAKRVLGGSSLSDLAAAALSPDGTRLAYVTWKGADEPGERGSLHVLDLRTLADRPIPGFSTDRPYWRSGGDGLAWSPDGRRLVFTGFDDSGQHLFLLDLALGTVRQLTASGGDSGGETQASFSPDGKHIVYVAERGYGGDDEFPLLP
ncbi:MAG: TolB family protein [Gaiellaceae bacterium]